MMNMMKVVIYDYIVDNKDGYVDGDVGGRVGDDDNEEDNHDEAG